LVNKLLEDGRLSELGVIVIDELHMVSLSKTEVLLRTSSLCLKPFVVGTFMVIHTAPIFCNASPLPWELSFQQALRILM